MLLHRLAFVPLPAGRVRKNSAHLRRLSRNTVAQVARQPALHPTVDSVAAADYLNSCGICVPESALKRSPELNVSGGVSIGGKVEPMLHFLEQQGLVPKEVELMLLRCPKLFTYNVECRSAPVVEFLAGLGFSHQQVAATIKRFPHLLGYDTKGHLIPHCHYLKSLGLSDEDLRQLILLRPHVLGASIELVITYLRKWLRIERTHVGRLLWSYPLDYSLPRLVLPSQVAAQDSSDESIEGSSSSSSAAPGAAGEAEDEQQQQSVRPPIGSPERCTWLDLRSGGSSDGDNGSSSGSA